MLGLVAILGVVTALIGVVTGEILPTFSGAILISIAFIIFWNRYT